MTEFVPVSKCHDHGPGEKSYRGDCTCVLSVLRPIQCCGSPDLILEKLQALLAALAITEDMGHLAKEDEDKRYAEKYAALDVALGKSPNADRELWLHVADFLDLTEHGGGIGGSWLTGLGADVLAALDEHFAEGETEKTS